MRIGVGPGERERGNADPGAAIAVAADADGRFSSFWLPQGQGFDSLTVLSLVGQVARSIELGVAVIPVQFQHPSVLASHALTAQAATENRIVLGLGVAHTYVLAARGMPFERPASYMQEYLQVLGPLLHERSVDITGERVSGHMDLHVPSSVPAPPMLVAALGPRMLRIAGELADGTVVWLTGARTVEDHIVPTITAAAAAADRPAPRVVASLPVCLTDDPVAARALADEHYGFYNDLPSYRAMLDREGVKDPADVAIIGDERVVAAGVQRMADAGATDFLARVFGTDEERIQTLSFLSLLQD